MILTPSDRISIIKAIAISFQQENWADIDLAFSQFKLQSIDWEGSDKKAYCLAMLKDASDQTLIEMSKHIGSPFMVDPIGTVGIPTFWTPGHFKLFVSHLAAEKIYATKLQLHLDRHGISGFVAHKDIEPTKLWQNEIETALASCDALVALMHPGFHQSKWTDQELGYAMGRKVPVFAVRLGEDPYGFIGKFQAFQGIDKTPEQIGTQIFETLVTHPQTQEAFATHVVNLFEESGSFASAATRLEYVEKLKVWDKSFNDRIVKAYNENTQIKGSWDVGRPRLNKLLAKWGGDPIPGPVDEDMPF
jgi:hypothetical protein